MKTFIKTAVLRPVTICVLVIILLATGVLATMDMSTALLPGIQMPIFGVSVVYPGASAQSVEKDVTKVLASGLKSVTGVVETETYSYENVGMVILTCDYGIDVDKKRDEIAQVVDNTSLPSSCYKPIVIAVDMNSGAVATVALYNDSNDIDKLNADAQTLKEMMGGIEGVESVSLVGAPTQQIEIHSLEGFDMASLLIMQALQSENLDIPIGSIMADGSVVSIRNSSDANSIYDIMTLPVSVSLGGVASQLNNLKNIVNMYQTATLQEVEQYVSQADGMHDLMTQIDGMTSTELNQMKTLLPFVTNMMNSAREGGAMYNDFRKVYPDSDTNGDGTLDGNDITYEQFALLFTDGGSRVIDGEEVSFDGYKFFHTDVAHQSCDATCTQDVYTYQQVAEILRFAENVDSAILQEIVDAKKAAEEAGTTATIDNEVYVRLFSSVTDVPVTEQLVEIVRRSDFKTNISSVLLEYKRKHVVLDEGEDYGKPVYSNGQLCVVDNGRLTANGQLVNNYGWLVDGSGRYVDQQGNVLTLTEAQKIERYNNLGEYIIFSDEELLELYNTMGIDVGIEFGITTDTIRFVRVTDFNTSDGTIVVPLCALGKVEQVDTYSGYAQMNGHLAVMVEVYASTDADTTYIVDKVKEAMAEISADSANTIVLLDDKSEFISQSISNVLSSIIIGGVLAILVIYLFVRRIRSSLVVAITMPLSVLVALLCMWAMGLTLNMVSLGGLAVGIGMLVDNSIVVLESITKYRDSGHSIFDSCVKGTREVAGSLLASTLTNICVFFPILFTQGLTREIFYDLVWAILYSIVMSLIVAVTVIPSLYHLVYKRNPQKKVVNADGSVTMVSREEGEPRKKAIVEKAQRKVEKMQKAVVNSERKYGKLLSKALKHKVVICVVALVLFASSVLLVFSTGMEFMPSVDKGEIEVNIGFTAQDSLEDVYETTLNVADSIKADLGDVVTDIAITAGKQGMVALENTGKIRITIDTKLAQTGTTTQHIREFVKQFDLSSVSVMEMDGVVAEITSGMSGTSVVLLGDDPAVLSEIAGKVEEKLLEDENIVSVINQDAQKSTQYSIVIDKTKCTELGVNYSNAVMMLRVGISGQTGATLDIDGQQQNVIVSFNENSVNSLEDMLNLVVGFATDGSSVRLVDVLQRDDEGNYEGTGLVKEEVVSVIKTLNDSYQVALDVESYGADSGTVSEKINNIVNEVLADYPGYTYQEGGVSKYLNQAFDGLVVSLIAAFLLLYGVMACQFESLLKPLVVIVSIPFAMTGGFLALVITGTPLSIVSFVGIIMLMGVIVNGAIIMVDKIDLLIKSGVPVQQAVVEGTASRLRPILMTTLTTILALVPLALGLGEGGELMQPMGIVVFGGLLLGTLVTLVLVPCFYCIVKRVSFKNYTFDADNYGTAIVDLEKMEQPEIAATDCSGTDSETETKQ